MENFTPEIITALAQYPMVLILFFLYWKERNYSREMVEMYRAEVARHESALLTLFQNIGRCPMVNRSNPLENTEDRQD